MMSLLVQLINFSLLSGRCDPDDLRVEEDELRPPQPPPRPEEQDLVTDIEAELLWEAQPHPPRGDVPNRRPYLDYGGGDPQDQPVPSYSHRRPPGTGRSGDSGDYLAHGGQKVGSLTSCLQTCSGGWRVNDQRVFQVRLSGERRSEEKVWTVRPPHFIQVDKDSVLMLARFSFSSTV